MELLAAMYKIPRVQYLRTLDEFEPVFEISPIMGIPARKLSLGQRMRADLMAAMLHRPPVLFLDEPTIGLDVVVKKRIRTCLKQVNQAGVTILLTTHDLDDIQQLCKRVMVINHGQMVFDGGLAELNARTGAATTVRVEYTSGYSRGQLPGVRITPLNGSSVEVSFQRQVIPAGEIIATLTTWGQVKDIHIMEPDIEDVIMAIYKESA
jgi:ABC-2 type transport system ATP-binding protein